MSSGSMDGNGLDQGSPESEAGSDSEPSAHTLVPPPPPASEPVTTAEVTMVPPPPLATTPDPASDVTVEPPAPRHALSAPPVPNPEASPIDETTVKSRPVRPAVVEATMARTPRSEGPAVEATVTRDTFQPVAPLSVPQPPIVPAKRGMGTGMKVLLGAVAGFWTLGLIGGGVWFSINRLNNDDSSPAASASPAASPATSSPTPQPPAKCWNDGAEVDDVSECPELTGAEGMAWVFPESAQCRAGQDLGISGTSVVRTTVRICDVQTASGWTEVAYSEYASADDLETAMAYIYKDADPEPVGDRLKYGPQQVPTKSGIPAIKGTWVYSDGRRWAATAGKGANSATASDALDALEMRSLKELKASAPE